jgi:hypothetical protein
MGVITYPLQILRTIEQRWANQASRQAQRSNPAGTAICDCGELLVAPCQSTYSAVGVINKWHCTKCGQIWHTYAAPSPASQGGIPA